MISVTAACRRRRPPFNLYPSVRGVTTNTSYLLNVLYHPDFAEVTA